MELDEEVTKLLPQPSPCPKTRDLWGCPGCGLREGHTKDLAESSTCPSDLPSLTPSCWTEGCGSFGRRVDCSCPRASSLGSLWGYGR